MEFGHKLQQHFCRESEWRCSVDKSTRAAASGCCSAARYADCRLQGVSHADSWALQWGQHTLGWFKILMFWSWDLCTSHLICTTLMIISSYSEDFCHLQPLRASHRKFSGTVGDIENRTSPNPPFMGIQTSVCGH